MTKHQSDGIHGRHGPGATGHTWNWAHNSGILHSGMYIPTRCKAPMSAASRMVSRPRQGSNMFQRQAFAATKQIGGEARCTRNLYARARGNRAESPCNFASPASPPASRSAEPGLCWALPAPARLRAPKLPGPRRRGQASEAMGTRFPQ